MPELVRVAQVGNLATQASVNTIDDFVDDLETRLSAVRAGLLDNLDATVASRMSAASGATAAALTTAQTDLTTLLARLSAARAGFLDLLSVDQNGSAVVPVVWPVLADGVDATAGTAWVYGAYVQLSAAVSGANVLLGIQTHNTSAAAKYVIDIAHGAAASEVVIWRFTHGTTAASTPAAFIPCRFPPAITSGARLAARVASDTGSATIRLKAIILPRPVV